MRVEGKGRGIEKRGLRGEKTEVCEQMRLVKRSDGSVQGCVCGWQDKTGRKKVGRHGSRKDIKKRRCKDKGGGGVEGHRGGEGEDEA